MIIIVTASAYSPRKPETAVAARSTSTIKSLNWFKKIAQGEVLTALSSSLGPNLAALSLTSLSDRPFLKSVLNLSTTSCWVREYQRPDITSHPLFNNFLIIPIICRAEENNYRK
jgi:hypothetical protein